MPPRMKAKLNFSGVNQFGKALEGAVVGALDVIRETAGGELFHCQMVLEAFTANALSRAARVGAVAEFRVARLFAFHAGRVTRFEGERQLETARHA